MTRFFVLFGKIFLPIFYFWGGIKKEAVPRVGQERYILRYELNLPMKEPPAGSAGGSFSWLERYGKGVVNNYVKHVCLNSCYLYSTPFGGRNASISLDW